MMLFSVLLLTKFFSSPKKQAVFQSRAGSCGGGIPPEVPGGVASLQQKIDSAKDGETIVVPKGSYFSDAAVPLGLGDAIFVSAARGASTTCMIRIEGKKLTLKGEAGGSSVFYGEGHSKPYQDPYQNRGGICVINSDVTFDNLTIKEFQKRCMVVYDSNVIVKNSIIEGCDEGGVSLLGNSTGLIVNNYIVAHNFGGVMLWQNSQAKIINNLFVNAAIMFFYHPKTNDKAYAEISNNIIQNATPILQVDWWKEQLPQLKTNKLSYNLLWRGEGRTCSGTEYCEEFPGKIEADPMFNEPVIDPCGIAAWANFGFKDGSPAVGVGDPNIPGVKTLGVSGGPCTEPNSSTCSTFISSNKPQPLAQPTPTEELQPEEPVPETEKEIIPTQPAGSRPIIPRVTTFQEKNQFSYGQITPKNNKVFYEQKILYIENGSDSKSLKIKGLILGNSYQQLNRDLSGNTNFKYSLDTACNGNTEIKAGLLYSSSEDDFRSDRYKNLVLSCYKTEIITIK